jgi:hypothetical protein
MKLSILSVCLLAFLFTFSTQTFATTFTVNLTTDQFDFFIGDGTCDVDQVTAGSQCTLRAAIQEINQTSALDVDNINFAIAGTGLQTIQLNNGLPTITKPVVIDGYSQPGASPNTLPIGNNAVFSIEIRQNGSSVNTFVISGGNSTLKGLLFNQGGTSGGLGDGTMVTFITNGGNHIEGCWFGLKPDGTATSTRINTGINDFSSGNVVGGLSSSVRNVISNLSFAINSTSSGGDRGSNSVIQNNYIGTDPSGTQVRGIFGSVSIFGAIDVGNSSIVGGADPSARNVIAGFGGTGITSSSSNSTIQNNYIGVAVDGVTFLSEGNIGIQVFENYTSNININATIINNVIGRFRSSGIALGGATPNPGIAGTVVRGNSIGVINNGSVAESGSRGISIQGFNNVIGGINGLTTGSCTGDCNIIANYNKGIVVLVISNPPGNNNQILGNSIYSNTDLGIDLNNDGVTPNDVGDPDTGANDLQNFPFIDSVTSGSTRVTGRFFSTANRTFRLEFFNNPTVDASGYGEGQIYIGAINVTTDANGRADFDNTFAYNSPAGSFVTSTATDLTTLNTSEFSFAIQVQAGPTAASVTVGGRVITSRGRGIRNVVVTMTDLNGNTRTATSSSSGYYRFTDVPAGETYIFTARGKRFSFRQNSQVHSIVEDIDDINFVASDQSVLSVN